MKEAAAHVAEQKIEELRALDYGELALDGNPVPVELDRPRRPGVLRQRQRIYRWNQKSDTPAGTPSRSSSTPPTARSPRPPRAVERRADRRQGPPLRDLRGGRRSRSATRAPDTSAYKRITVAVTVENALGPQKPILVSTVVGQPRGRRTARDPTRSSRPTPSARTRAATQVECTNSVGGTVSTWYLYDTPATFATRQDIVGSHATHATVAPNGTCSGGTTTGCPKPDLMGTEPPPAPAVTPPVYNYSNEITGGTTPGGAVVRRDTGCQRDGHDDRQHEGPHVGDGAAAVGDDAHGRCRPEPLDADVQRRDGRRDALHRALQRPREHLEPRREPADATWNAEALHQQQHGAWPTTATSLGHDAGHVLGRGHLHDPGGQPARRADLGRVLVRGGSRRPLTTTLSTRASSR